MTGVPKMTGQCVLIVEDDYSVASDVAATFRGAGAEVLGPCTNMERTTSLLEHEVPTAAVIDLNLGGGGPNLVIARKLKQLGIKFVFLTGYDSDVIPPEMMEVTRLQKPWPLREVVEVVSRLQHA